MKLEKVALQLVRSAEEAQQILLGDCPEIFSLLSAEDLAAVAAYVAASVRHGNTIQRISFREKRGLVMPVWPKRLYNPPSDLIWCLLVKPVGLRPRQISLRNPVLYYCNMRLDADLIKNKTKSEISTLVRQLMFGNQSANPYS